MGASADDVLLPVLLSAHGAACVLPRLAQLSQVVSMPVFIVYGIGDELTYGMPRSRSPVNQGPNYAVSFVRIHLRAPPPLEPCMYVSHRILVQLAVVPKVTKMLAHQMPLTKAR